MAIHHPTPPLVGGERPRLPSAQVGPVTQAIRAMQRPAWPLHGVRQLGDDHNVGKSDVFRFEDSGIRALSRTEVEDLIGGLIDLLDAMDGDADAEDVDVDLEDGHDAEGNTDDNGIADYDAIGEQGFLGYGRCA
ncbi:hypothetical protein [Methylobacterium sp. Leaf361]|uniref:hypothetical protein n=1 Tax=Methylobacterium sp. Leaf361 TaxID=1736352 RepID=UPI001FCCF7F0|nr:hypothetical protein [Methylobacterium sp. Leaf361]